MINTSPIITEKIKKSSNISQQIKISCNHFFFRQYFFQLIFLRPLSRLRNFLISFTIHKIRSLLASLTHSLHSPHKYQKRQKMLKMPPSPPQHEKSREVDKFFSVHFLNFFFSGCHISSIFLINALH